MITPSHKRDRDIKTQDQYTEYKESRGDWEETYRNGLELLGFKYERRTEPFRGASGVNHPVLAEAVTQFQAQAYKELLPADGPVRTQILGDVNISCQSDADYIEFWLDGNLLSVLNNEPFNNLAKKYFIIGRYDDLLSDTIYTQSNNINASDFLLLITLTDYLDNIKIKLLH